NIISIAHRLSHMSVAEGVEHEQQLQLLRSYGCDRVQGYLISRPLNEHAAVSLIGRQGDAAAERNAHGN
ncbi:MAG: EAL domain-containing protein, partial [Clostridiales bacterium]|nr:EAL domain-containing protein [Clostridiales bacterium]